ncbi:hypothetical protein [Rhodocyclus gracilis]|uniref:hypothetical protein n=1 Tax=Rhodocyclus gracilis TaxID=2929842 RepID=UPI00188F53CA|nr:hypothetical protein [Rhodocyclus gracilis]
MALQFVDSCAHFVDTVGVEEAEVLLDWLQKTPDAVIDFGPCTHVHPANLQVLMAANASVRAWPAETRLADWLRPLFPTPEPTVAPEPKRKRRKAA